MRLSLVKVMLFFSFLSLSAGASEVEVVEKVDLTRYQGQWYEVASIPQSFQKECIKNVQAEYKIAKNGLVEVFNSCDTTKGRKVTEGRAKVIDSESNAKLKVTFVKFFDWIFSFGGDYWVIALEANYQYAVVGHPTREYGWILSRTPSLSYNDLETIKSELERQGYNTCKFNLTVQDGGYPVRESLCKN